MAIPFRAEAISGSITRTVNDVSYLVAGSNITIASASNGQITISSTGGGGGADVDWTDGGGELYTTSSVYILTASNGELGSDVTFFVSGTVTDDNSSTDKSLFAGEIVVSGSSLFVSGLSGSLTKLVDGTSYISTIDETPIINVESSSNGGITLENNFGASAFMRQASSQVPGGYVLTTGDGITEADTFPGGQATRTFSADGSVARVSGTNFTGNITVEGTGSFQLGLSGSLTRLTDGSSFIEAGDNITVSSASNGAITISATGGSGADADWLDTGGTLSTTSSVYVPDLFVSGGITQSTGLWNVSAQPLYVGSGSGSPNNLIEVASGTMALMGYPGADNAPGSDVVIFLSGSPGSRAYGNKGTTVVGGDLAVSGTIYCLTSSNDQPALRLTKEAGPGRVSPVFQNGPWMQLDRGKNPGDFSSDLGATFSIGVMSGTTGDFLVIGQGTAPDQAYVSGTAYLMGGAYPNTAWFSGSQPLGTHHFYLNPGGNFSITSGEFNEFFSIDVGSGSNGHQVDIGAKANTRTTVSTGGSQSQHQTGSFSIIEDPTSISSGSQRRVGTSQQTTDASLENALLLKTIDGAAGGGDALMFYKDNGGNVVTRKYLFNYQMNGSHVSSVDYEQYASLGTADPFGLYFTGSAGYVAIQVSGSASVQADWRIEATYFSG